MFILDAVSNIRTILFTIDQVAFSLIDNAYNLIVVFSKAEFFKSDAITGIMNSTYVVIGLFALFKMAVLLVNAIVSPDRLFDKDKGFVVIIRNVVIMFALLIFVPILFKESMNLQSTIVEGNYVNRLFGLNVPDNYNPGDMFKAQAISALVHPNEAFAVYKNNKYEITTGNNGTDKYCKDDSTHCKEAIEDYNKALFGTEEQRKHMFSTLLDHMGDYVKDDFGNGKEKIYVYDYSMFLTFIVGIAITYLLILFCFDLAERVIKLAILEIVSPLFIVTYIDPKSAKSGPFSNWLKEVGSTYVSLYIRLAALALIIILTTLWQQRNTDINLGGWGNIVFILSILIFAKNFPKWLGGLIGVKDFDGGLGGLGKRLGSAALVGGMLTKAGHGALGLASGTAKATANQISHRKALKNAAYKNAGLNKGIGKDNKKARNDWYENNKDKYADMSKRKAIRAARKEALLNDTAYSGAKTDKDGNKVPAMQPHLTGLKQFGAAALMGAVSGGQAGFKADNIKGAFKGGITASNNLAKDLALEHHTGFAGKIGNFIKGLPGAAVESAYGSSNDLYEMRDKQGKRLKVKSWTEKGNYGTQDVGIGKGKIAAGQGDINKICDKISTNKDNMGDLNNASFAAAQYGINRGYVETDDKGNIKNLDNIKYNADSKSFDFIGSDGKVKETIKSEKLEANCGGIIDSSSAGSANQEKMVNTYKNQALSNYQQNEQIRSQEISSYQTSKAESDKIQSGLVGMNAILGGLGLTLDAKSASTIADSVLQGTNRINKEIEKLNKTMEASQDKKDHLKDLNEKLEDNKLLAKADNEGALEKIVSLLNDKDLGIAKEGETIPVSKENLDNYIKVAQNIINQQLNEFNAVEQQKKNFEGMLSKISEYQSIAGGGKEAKNAFDSAMSANLANIQAVSNAQNELKSVIDSIKGSTISEKANTLSIEEKKISSRIEGLTKKDDEK